MATHVEFETDGALHLVRREDVSLYRGRDGEWSAFLADSDQPERISPETAARLRRELLGEGEAAPPVVTQPGVYRDQSGWGRRIGGCDEAGWYAESPEGERGDYRWGDDGEEEDGIPAEALTERVADLDAWNLSHERDVCPAELAAMLAASKPAAEPEFVLFRLGLLTADGTFSTTYPLEAEEDVRRQLRLYGGRVVELYRRREDETLLPTLAALLYAACPHL